MLYVVDTGEGQSYSIWYHVPWDSKVLFRVVYLDGWMAGWLAGSEQNDGRCREIDKMVGEHSSSLSHGGRKSGRQPWKSITPRSDALFFVVFLGPWSWMLISLSPAFVRLLD